VEAPIVEAPTPENASLPALAAIGIIAVLVVFSIATYLLLSAR